MSEVIENSGWQDQSIEVSDLIAAQDKKFVKDMGQYNVSNPHPLYGKDPNIINEFGHTMYPKWVKSASGQDVIVKSAKEEAALPKASVPQAGQQVSAANAEDEIAKLKAQLAEAEAKLNQKPDEKIPDASGWGA